MVLDKLIKLRPSQHCTHTTIICCKYHLWWRNMYATLFAYVCFPLKPTLVPLFADQRGTIYWITTATHSAMKLPSFWQEKAFPLTSPVCLKTSLIREFCHQTRQNFLFFKQITNKQKVLCIKSFGFQFHVTFVLLINIWADFDDLLKNFPFQNMFV